MAHEHFPIFRLATQIARQMSAPIASRIKEYARTHPRFARTVCMRSGRLYRDVELRFKVFTLRLRQPPVVNVSDADALNMGADILGEATLFLLLALIVTFEVNRQAMKQEMKVLEEESQWLAIMLSLKELKEELALQQADIDRFMETLKRIAAEDGEAEDTPPGNPSLVSPDQTPARNRMLLSEIPHANSTSLQLP